MGPWAQGLMGPWAIWPVGPWVKEVRDLGTNSATWPESSLVQRDVLNYDPSEGPLLVPLKEKCAVDNGWNRIFDDLETFLTLFFILGSKVDVPRDENRLSHNALTRRIDPRYPEGPRICF